MPFDPPLVVRGTHDDGVYSRQPPRIPRPASTATNRRAKRPVAIDAAQGHAAPFFSDPAIAVGAGAAGRLSIDRPWSHSGHGGPEAMTEIASP